MLDKTKVTLRPATTRDAAFFFNGGTPGHRLRAWVGESEGELLGIGGIYFLPDGTRVGFVELADEGYKYPRALICATHQFLSMLKTEGVRSVIAVADPKIEAATRFMLHFGFTPGPTVQSHTIYQWTGD